ncbi:MAG: NAD(P)H-quinone oxidoreductase [Synechococcus sp. SB0668_bin_15]|nr:NAD(P)H-quinone oxidoreductase [Synechococcus sp. SB0668_bin_15]MYC50298.1 NAD(P)H-quinone oxidoreductase [Synechococcus sp. SB0662_bin_14]
MAPTGSPSAADKARSPLKLKKGSLVKVDRHAYLADASRAASDPDPPDYLFLGPGELLQMKPDAALIRWRLPVPDVWLPVDVLSLYE